jgi:hypothetical protein
LAGPSEQIRFAADDPGTVLIKPEADIGYRRNLNRRCGVDRWTVGDRNHDYDPPARFLYGGGDQGAGPIRAFFGGRLPVIRPKITVPQDPAESGAPRSLFLELGVEMFEAVLHFARPDRREFSSLRRSRAFSRSYSPYDSTALRGRPCLVMTTGWLSERSNASPTWSWNSLAVRVTLVMEDLRFRAGICKIIWSRLRPPIG